jgi:hypothetical protein
MLVEAMVRQQDFVCNRLVTFQPRGQFERGYFEKVTCSSDGPKDFVYRLDMTPNFERYSGRVWSPLLDD